MHGSIVNIDYNMQGRIQDFKLRGGGGGALKKIAPSGGRRENFWDITCEKSRFYAKKSYFFQLRREVRKFLGFFRVKNHDFTPKNHIFFKFRGGGARAGCAPPPPPPPPGSAPDMYSFLNPASFINEKSQLLL